MMNSLKFLFSLSFFCIGLNVVFAQVSPFNKREISCPDTLPLRFLVSGHFHGSSSNTTGLPAKTLLYNLEKINSSQPCFMVSLGDLFLDVKKDIPVYSDTLFKRMTFPLFNVVGNHDVSGNVYTDHFGPTWFAIRHSGSLFLFLDTEINDGSIEGEQLKFLDDQLSHLKSVYRIFVFMHRLVWAEDHPQMKHLFKDNTRSSSPGNFRSEILPRFEDASKHMEVYFFGGSLGAAGASFFYHKEEKKSLTYIATAIRDTPFDAMLSVEVDSSGVHFSSFPLTMPPNYYNIEYYSGTQEKSNTGFNWRLVPLYMKQTLSHRFFWYGLFLGALFLMSFMFVFKKLRRKK
jgi:hypothetical protein